MNDNTINPTEIQLAEHSHNAEAPEPSLEPVAPVISIIEEEPLKMARSLSLVNRKAYVAAWIFDWPSAWDYQSAKLCAFLSVRRQCRGVCLMWEWMSLTKKSRSGRGEK